MKTIKQVREYIHDTKLTDQIMVQLCGGDHPLTDYLVECYKDEHKDKVPELTESNVISEMQRYMEFAIEKAKHRRGISAGRSMWKFQQWLWVLEDESFGDIAANYDGYGLQILEDIKEKYQL